MSLNVAASHAYFKNLKCAYTGLPITVRAVSHGNSQALFFSPDAFDPTIFRGSSKDLFALLGTRGGVRGAARNGAELVCPYTGAQMTVKEVTGLGYQALGGFSPTTPCNDPVEFARALMTRGGKVPAKAPKPTPAPKMAKISPVENGESGPETPMALAHDVVDRLVHKVAKPIKVSMSTKGA